MYALGDAHIQSTYRDWKKRYYSSTLLLVDTSLNRKENEKLIIPSAS